MEVIQLRDYSRRVRVGVHGQQVHDQIAEALKASSRVRLDFAVARLGATVLRSIVFTHCSKRVEASIVKPRRRISGKRGQRRPDIV